jgi:hypothetical protein
VAGRRHRDRLDARIDAAAEAGGEHGRERLREVRAHRLAGVEEGAAAGARSAWMARATTSRGASSAAGW